MTRKEAKEILVKFAEENKYKSDWNGFLAGAIATYLEPIDEERLNTLAYEAVMSKETQDILKKCLYEPTEKHIQYYVDTPRIFQEGYIAGYRKAMEE